MQGENISAMLHTFKVGTLSRVFEKSHKLTVQQGKIYKAQFELLKYISTTQRIICKSWIKAGNTN